MTTDEQMAEVHRIYCVLKDVIHEHADEIIRNDALPPIVVLGAFTMLTADFAQHFLGSAAEPAMMGLASACFKDKGKWTAMQ